MRDIIIVVLVVGIITSIGAASAYISNRVSIWLERKSAKEQEDA